MLMTATSQTRDDKPWYRYGWVWFLISIPLSAVIVGSFMIYIAVTQADSLVADDYYKEGRAINQRLEKDQKALELGIRLTPSILQQKEGSLEIRVEFEAKPSVAAPEIIRLKMSHPTLNHLDVLASLQKTSSNTYQTRVPAIAPGKWYVQLEDPNALWRVKSVWIVE